MKIVNTILFSSDAKLRSGWRFLCFGIACLFLSSLFFALFYLILIRLPGGVANQFILGFIAQNLAVILGATLAGWIGGRLFENVPFKALGIGANLLASKNLVLGILLGAGALVFAALIAMGFGGMTFQINSSFSSSVILKTVGMSFGVFIVAAAAEEIVFRGYMLQTFLRARMDVAAIVFTSVLFAFIHANNPNVNYFGLANTFLAGIWFAVAYVRTRSLWLPIGLHFSWNWFQGSVFGMSVSGIKEISEAPLMNAIDTGPTWLTGGHYGVEGGIACTIAIAVSTVIVAFLPIIKVDEELLALTGGKDFTPSVS
jgi:membrane protease YdiL (CAAX protease family)